MNPILHIAVFVVTCALLSYSFAVIPAQRKRRISKSTLAFLTIGVVLDVTATALMIWGSKNIPLTPHGILGYSALVAMVTDTVLLWKLHMRKETEIPRKLHLYTRFAYGWWVFAYVAGAMLAMSMAKGK